MRSSGLAVGAVLFYLVFIPSNARAQTSSGDLANVLLTFFSPQNPVILAANPNPAFSHAAHFVSQAEAQAVLKQVNAGIAAQISTFPIGASSAGFTYTFDESLGVYNRTTQSFGPIFTERPLTAGKNKFTFGVNYQDATWDSLEGIDLKNGDMTFYLTHQDVNHDGSNLTPWFEGDIIRANLRIDLESKTTVLYANYG